MAGKRPTNKLKEARDRKIAFEMRAGVIGPDEIAEKHGVSRRTVLRAMAWDEQNRPEQDEQDTNQFIQDRLLFFEVALGDLGWVRIDPEASRREKMRAIEVQNKVYLEKAEFMMKVGLIPRPGPIRDSARRQVMREFEKHLDESNYDPRLPRMVRDFADRWLEKPAGDPPTP